MIDNFKNTKFSDEYLKSLEFDISFEIVISKDFYLAVKYVISQNGFSISTLMRQFYFSFKYATKIIDNMLSLGIIKHSEITHKYDVSSEAQRFIEEREQYFDDKEIIIQETNAALSVDKIQETNSSLSVDKIRISDIGLPQIIEKKLLSSVNYQKTIGGLPINLLLIGCPTKFVSQILESIANETSTNLKLIEDVNLKQGDLAGILTNISVGDFVCFKNLEALSSEIIHTIKQVMRSFILDITIGKGPAARNISIPLPKFGTIITVENISQIPSDMIDLFYDIIDFKKFGIELRLMYIVDFGKKYNLNFSQSAKEYLAKQFTDEQLKIQLIEIRNRAFETNETNITEEFIQNKSEEIPAFEDIDAMNGREFELFTGKLFRELGYSNVVVTQSSCDFGVDVIAEKDDVKFAIQCKRYCAPVGISAVQEVIASKSLHDCHVACVLTNNTFTPAAEELARKNLVILWNGEKLKKFIERAK